MAYTKTTWTVGDVITAEKLNKIEDMLAYLDENAGMKSFILNLEEDDIDTDHADAGLFKVSDTQLQQLLTLRPAIFQIYEESSLLDNTTNYIFENSIGGSIGGEENVLTVTRANSDMLYTARVITSTTWDSSTVSGNKNGAISFSVESENGNSYLFTYSNVDGQKDFSIDIGGSFSLESDNFWHLDLNSSTTTTK